MKYFLVNNVLTLTIIFLITTAIPRFIHDFTSVYGLILRTEHTFGQTGIILTVLILTMLTYNKYRWALFLLGIQYGIHAAWAFWSTLLLITFLYFQRRKIPTKLICKYTLSLLAGSLATVTIFTFHKFLLPNSSYDFQSESNNLIGIYLKFWDYHRNRPFDLYSIFCSVVLVVLLLLFANFTKKSFSQLATLNTTIAISSLISTLLYVLNDGWLKNNFVPLSLLMPGRFMNFHALFALPLIIINLNYCMSLFKRKINLTDYYLSSISIVMFPPILVLYLYFFTDHLQKIPFQLRNSVTNVYNSEAEYCEDLNKDDKHILTSGISSRLIPINCKRSIILDSHTIDFIPYLPKGVIELKNLTEQLYGIDFDDPRVSFQIAGQDFTKSGAIPPEVIKPFWEMRTLSDWNLLACKYDFSNIVTPSNYEITLPIIFSDNNITIFEVKPDCN